MFTESKGFETLHPKTAFFLGLGGGVLGVCTLGFFILLGSMMTGGELKLGEKDSGSVAKATVTAPTPTAPAAEPSAGEPSGAPPVISDTDHVRGDANAPVTLIEYSDFECPFCQRFHATLQQVMDNYPGKVRWAYRHFPLSFHANAQKEAEASECAAELGGNDAFWKYGDAIFARTTANGTGFALDKLVPLAKEIGLNEAKFKECLDSGKYAQKVRDQMNAGAAAGVTGTPGTFVVNANGEAQLIPGALPYESVAQVIDSLLQ
ncbi:MAG: DsbA family protein [bacterium]|nr:DsbA family protein [bacterium]